MMTKIKTVYFCFHVAFIAKPRLPIFLLLAMLSLGISDFTLAQNNQTKITASKAKAKTQNAKSDFVVEDQIDPKEHIENLEWGDTRPWGSIRTSWFQNDLLWPYYEEVVKKPYSLADKDYQILLKGIAYLSWKAEKDYFTAEFVASLKNQKKLNANQVNKLFQSISFEPAKQKLRKDYSILTRVSRQGQDAETEGPTEPTEPTEGPTEPTGN